MILRKGQSLNVFLIQMKLLKVVEVYVFLMMVSISVFWEVLLILTKMILFIILISMEI